MKLSIKIVLIITLLSILPLLVIGFFSLASFQNQLSEQILEERQGAVSNTAESLHIILNDFKEDVITIRGFPPIQGIIRAKENDGVDPLDGSNIKDWEERLTTIFSKIVEVQDSIDQIRYLDENGQEVVRVNNLDNILEVVPKENLQNKQNREYFIETMKLKEGEVYISELDLNVEGNKIEIPHRPVLRFATPVFSEKSGERKGAIIMNVQGDSILDFLKEKKGGGELILSDEEGNFIFNEENKEKEFSKYLETEFNYFIEHPELIENTQDREFRNYHDKKDEEYRTWRKIYYNENKDDKYWILFMIDKEEDLFSSIILFRNLFIYIFLGFVVLIGSLAFYFSRSVSDPIKQLHNLALDIEQGNLKSRVNINSKDELEVVGNNFNRAIESLEKLDDEHKQIEKSKTEFLSITSHELRSPMTPMQAQLQMLLGDYFGKLNKKQRDSLDIVLRNTKRLDRIIQDFLEISRAEAGRLKFKFVKTSLANHVARLKKEMDGFLPEKKIKIELKLSRLPMINVDPDRVMQVLRNLINNAKKFSPDNSTITISAQLENNLIKFFVRDEGIGIPLEDQQKIFTPFFQVDNMYQRKSGGTGLGLAICKGIIEAQNGKIWIESKERSGTTFYFTVPLKPVTEVKPIKLLFSNKTNIERKLKELYNNFLGPLWENEFNRLSGNLKASNILSNINYLEKEKIIETTNASRFRDSVMSVFSKQENFIKGKNDTLLKETNIGSEDRLRRGLRKKNVV